MSTVSHGNNTSVSNALVGSILAAATIFTITAVEDLVTAVVSSLLGDTGFASDTPLMDAGFDSLSATDLVQQLGA